MKVKRTSRYSSILLKNKVLAACFLAFTATGVQGQTLTGEMGGRNVTIDSTLTVSGKDTKPTQWTPSLTDEKPPLMLFQGFTLSVDVLGAGMRALTDYGTLEAALRLNLKNTYFPIAELGYGDCDHTDDNTNIQYSAHAPYMRIGFDYNILKDKYQANRLFVGLRYGISNFNYDVSGPEMSDPIWGGAETFSQSGINCTSHWLEVCFGCQVQIWQNFHMGWSLRYKSELSSTHSDFSKPYYIPGYGTTVNGSCWGGTYNLIFDLNWGKKSKKK